MLTIGPGAREIRIHTALEHRIVYIAKFAEAVYVLHAFEKRSRKTPRRDFEPARQRLQQFSFQRRSHGPA
jgi:phage-related protein